MIKQGRVREHTLFFHHKQGHRVPVRVISSPVRDQRGGIVGALEVFRPLSSEDGQLEEIQRLKAEVMTDHLTGIGNRRYGDIVLENLFHTEWHQKSAIGLAIVDIDHFKAVNDTYGHDVGDRVLQMVAETLKASMRPRDILCRWGGEEFLVALPGIPANQLLAVVERMRTIVGAAWLATEQSGPLSVTISAGAVLSTGDKPLTQVIKRADQLLYQAKKNGRNRSVVENRLEDVPLLRSSF